MLIYKNIYRYYDFGKYDDIMITQPLGLLGNNNNTNYNDNSYENNSQNEHFHKDDPTINNSSTNNDVISKSQSLYGKNIKPNHSLQRSSSRNELPEKLDNNNNKKKHRRLSIMDTPLPSNITEYKVYIT